MTGDALSHCICDLRHNILNGPARPIEGILLTMVDFRTNYARDIASRVHTTYGSQIEVFENVIPMSVKAAETSAEGKSIYMHCPKGKVAEAYMNLTQEDMYVMAAASFLNAPC